MNKSLLTTLSVLAASCCAALALPANAAVISKTVYMDPALSCQLSIPTTDTGIRPRATGFRNEGISPSFVICGIPYHYSFSGGSSGIPTAYRIGAASFDGQAHTFNCTGVSRSSTGSAVVYSTKSVSVSAGGSSTTTTWTDSDLTLGNFDASITCVIPKGAAIISVQMQYDDNV